MLSLCIVIHVLNKMSERKKSCISQWNVINNFLPSQSFFLFSDFILIVGTYQNSNLWRTWSVCCNSTTIRVVWWLNCVVLRCQNKTPEYKKKKSVLRNVTATFIHDFLSSFSWWIIIVFSNWSILQLQLGIRQRQKWWI